MSPKKENRKTLGVVIRQSGRRRGVRGGEEESIKIRRRLEEEKR